jgi:dipeptidyl-peptidase-4
LSPAIDDGRHPDDLAYPRQSARTRGYTCGQPRDAKVSPDGERVVFLRSAGGDDPVNRLWVLDVATGSERCVFDPLAAPGEEVALTPAERARRERMRERASGVVAYATDRDLTRAVFVEGGRLLVCELADGAWHELEAGGVPDDPHLSPDGSTVAYVLDGSLWAQPSAGGEARRLASDPDPDVSWGLAEFAAAEELGRRRGFWWSPDSARLAVARADERPVQVWWITDPTDPAAEPVKMRYPQAGSANALVTLHVVDVATGEIVDVGWDEPGRFEYLTRVLWDEHGLAIEVVARDFTETRVLAVDPDTGETSTLRTQTDPHWIEPTDGVPLRLDDGRLVTTVHHGDVRALAVDGAPVSPDDLHVAEVLEANGDGVLVISSHGDPTQDHVWRIVPGHASARLTEEPGLHTATGGDDVLVVRSWLEDRPHPRTRILRGDEVLVDLENLAEEPVVTPRTRYLRVGEHGLPVAVHVPGGRDPEDPLPVLVSSYGGPHVKMVNRYGGMFRSEQWFADRLGAVVLTIDGRGMLGHDLPWEWAVHRDFARTLDDQIDGLRATANELGFLDLDRVAFRGWSFGGELGALAVLKRPDVFHAAVAGAPVTDQRLYDTAYTERFLGTPQDAPEAYRHSSPISYVDHPGPHRPLLLIHGLADDNVYAANTLQLSAALFARGYHHDLVLLPNASHIGGFDDLVSARYVAELDFLRRSLGLEARGS